MDSEPDPNSLLFQLQVLMGFLKVSTKRWYDTISFCRAVKDYDGQPVSLGEQKDVNEFGNLLFDRLEESHPDMKRLVQSMFSGKTVSRIMKVCTCYHSFEWDTAIHCYALAVLCSERRYIIGTPGNLQHDYPGGEGL